MRSIRSKSFLIFVLVLSIFCINTTAWSANNVKYMLKMASVGPDGVRWATYCKNEIQKTIKKVTNGEVGFSWYWGCIMGDEEDSIAKMRIDQLQGGLLSLAGTGMICPELAIMTLPFMFNNYDEVNYMKKKMGSRFKKLTAEKGYKVLMLIHQDFDQIYSKYPMNTSEHYLKCKFVTYTGKNEAEVIKNLGSSPIPINVPEIASAIRSGIINTCISPAMWWLGSQLYTVSKYVNTTKIRYSPGTLVITMKAWNRIPKIHQKAIIKELPALEDGFCKEVITGNEKALRAMINYGMKEVILTPEETDSLKKKTRSVWNALADDMYPKTLLDEFTSTLDKYRSSKIKSKTQKTIKTLSLNK